MGTCHLRERLITAPTSMLALILGFLIFSACDRPDLDEGATSQEAIPSWITSVQPAPGQRSDVLSIVEVDHPVLPGAEDIRLEIDGTDVTSYSDFGRPQDGAGPGRLVYDGEREGNIVPLDPGEHTATLKLVEYTGAGEQHEILDTFTWSFTIQ